MSSEQGLDNVVGANVPHESATAHVSGSAQYIDDLPLPRRSLHVAVAFAPVARGTLEQLDQDAVRTAEGVVDVVVAADVPGGVEVGSVFPGDTLLAEQDIAFHGQALFAVAADTFRHAQQALRLARWEITPADAVLTLQQAIEADTKVLPSRDWGDRELTVSGEHLVQGALHIGGQ